MTTVCSCKIKMLLKVALLAFLLQLIALKTYSYVINPPLNCTRPNEEYQCGSACQTTCFNLGITCPIINIRCNDDCYCKPGYARKNEYTGECIPERQCPQWFNCVREHETFSCAGNCQRRCRGSDVCDQIDGDVNYGKCDPGCVCEIGYARDQNGNCILQENCPINTL